MTIRPTIRAAGSLFRRVWPLVIMATISSGALADKPMLSATVANSADKVAITATASSPLRVAEDHSSAGRFLSFEFPGVLMSRGNYVSVRNGGIYNVKYGSLRQNPPASRIVVNTRSALRHEMAYSPDKKQVTITVWKHGATPTHAIDIPASSEPAGKPAPKAVMDDSVAVRPVAASPAPKAKAVAKSRDHGDRVGSGRIAASPAPKAKVLMKSPDTRVVKVAKVAEKVAGYSEAVEPVKVAATPKPMPRVEVAELAKDGETATRPASVAQPAAKPIPIQTSGRVSLNFHEADVKDVLKALAAQTGSNIVAGKDVVGQTSVTLNNVSVEEALDYVTRMNGLAYEKVNNTYLVAAKDSPVFKTAASTTPVVENKKPEALVSKSVGIGDAVAEDMLAVLKARYPGVTAVVAGKSVVLTGSPEHVDEAREAVVLLAKSIESSRVARKTALYTVNYVKPSELAQTLMGVFPGVTVAFGPSEGFSLTAPRAQGSIGGIGGMVGGPSPPTSPAGEKKAAGKPTLTPETESRVLIIMGPDSDVTQALALAGSLDIKSPQIKLEAKITSLTASGEKKLGLTWQWDALSYKESPTRKFIRDPINFNATLDALYTSGDAQLLASPSLIGLAGKPSNFFVGDEVTYIQRVETTPTGQNVITDTKQVGVELRAIGEINSDGYVTLNLHPEVSTLQLQVDALSRITLPIVSRRFTDLSVRVKDGETFVIGGLIRNEETLDLKKIPGLGDIPFFGYLFRHRDKTHQKTEVVMIITASILKD